MRVKLGAVIDVPLSPFLAADGETPTTCDSPPLCTAVDGQGADLPDPTVSAVDSKPGYYTVRFTSDLTDTLRTVRLSTEGNVDGETVTITDFADIVGDHYASIPELRAMPGCRETDGVSTAELMALRDQFAGIVESFRGVSYVPQVSTVYLEGGCNHLFLPSVEVAGLVSVRQYDDTAGDFEEITGCEVTRDGRVTRRDGFLPPSTVGRPNVEITYQHGFEAPPAEAREACRQWVSITATQNAGTSRDVIAQTVDGVTLRYSTPDWSAGRPTGHPAVDALLRSLKDRRLPGIA